MAANMDRAVMRGFAVKYVNSDACKWRQIGLILCLTAPIVVAGRSCWQLPAHSQTTRPVADGDAGQSPVATNDDSMLKINDQHRLELVKVAKGSFWMGRDARKRGTLGILLRSDGVRGLDEGPRRHITITQDFYIGRFKVTCGQYCAFLNATYSAENPGQYVELNKYAGVEIRDGRFVPKAGCERCAISVVPWEGAKAFCDWLSKQTGRVVRLPTEAEWEYACGGCDSRRFPWGNKSEENTEYYFTPIAREPTECRAVDAFIGNSTPCGIQGMIGYVREWCSDYYGIEYLPGDTVDPKGPTEDELPVKSSNPVIATEEGKSRVLRGFPTCKSRFLGIAPNGAGIYGVRVVVEVEPAPVESPKPQVNK